MFNGGSRCHRCFLFFVVDGRKQKERRGCDQRFKSTCAKEIEIDVIFVQENKLFQSITFFSYCKRQKMGGSRNDYGKCVVAMSVVVVVVVVLK